VPARQFIFILSARNRNYLRHEHGGALDARLCFVDLGRR